MATEDEIAKAKEQIREDLEKLDLDKLLGFYYDRSIDADVDSERIEVILRFDRSRR